MPIEIHHKHKAPHWEKTGGSNPLKNHGNFQSLFDSVPHRFHAASQGDGILRCMDEGLAGGAIRMAGSGILYPKVTKDLRGQVSGVYSHKDCGAAKELAVRKGIAMEDADKLGDEEANRIARALGVPYYGCIPSHRMRRPEGLHTARTLYYVGSERFDPHQVQEIPSGLVLSRKPIKNPDYPLSEVALAIAIAQGEHGFGDMFTDKTPFYLVAVSDPHPDSIRISRLVDELKSVARDFNAVAVDSIRVSA